MRNTFTLLLVLLGTLHAAELKLAAIFSDHMILQRDVPASVWGSAEAGAKVNVEFASQNKTATADARGKWSVKLDALSAESKPQTLIVSSASESLKCEDVLVGEVWHASGQSNMAMTVGGVARALESVKAQIADYNFSSIRFRRVADGGSAAPVDDIKNGSWTVCSSGTVSDFSAAAFFFARRLHEELKLPVAVIDSSRGGTPIEPFIPREAFAAHPTLRREVELADQNDLAGLKALPGGVYARDANWFPGRLFNSRLAPLAAFAVRGAIWYQGESNSGVGEDPRDYEHKMRALIAGWRSALLNEKMPVYFVQLPGSGAGDNWPQLREEQRRCAGLANAGMVVTVDLVGAGIHPPNKVDVGERLARWALAKDYGKAIPFSGPLFSKAELLNGKFTVHFDHVGTGLMVASKDGLEAPVETPSTALRLFEVKNETGQWLPADAVISGKTLLVHSNQVPRPVALRYAFQKTPEGCNLYNRDRLPASPFNTDNHMLGTESPWAFFKGKSGAGAGRNIVFVTGDDEYKSEESMPMMAHILAERHGFDCTVLFAINKETGVIDTNQKDNIPGLDLLAKADLMIIYTRFRALPDDQMKRIDDYLSSGKPVIGLRTATHAFSFPKDSATGYARYTWNYSGDDFAGGFGQQVLGQTWVNHWGNHGRQSTRGVFAPNAAAHPILRGVGDGEIWGTTDVYEATLPQPSGCTPIMLGQVLQGMKPDDAPVTGEQMNGKWKKMIKVNNPMMPIAWTYARPVGAKGRVFTSTIGGAMAGRSDFESEGMRRMFVNACYWALGLEEKIPSKADVAPVLENNPFKRGVKPSLLAP